MQNITRRAALGGIAAVAVPGASAAVSDAVPIPAAIPTHDRLLHHLTEALAAANEIAPGDWHIRYGLRIEIGIILLANSDALKGDRP